MRLRKTTLLALFLSAVMGAPVADTLLENEAHARPKDPKERAEQRRENRKERAEERRENRKERAENRKERRHERRDRRQRKARKWAKGARKAWAGKQRHRRRMARRAFVRRWGKIYARPKVKNELTLHAWREARFERMRYLAEKSGNEEMLEKINELEAKEDERHDNRMDKLKSGDGAGGGAAATDTADTAAAADTAAPADTAAAATE